MGRAGGFFRLISRKPVTLPTGPDQLREGRLAPLGARPRLGHQHTLVVARHDLHEARPHSDPVTQDAGGVGRPGELDVTLDQIAHEADLVGLIEPLDVYHAEVAALPEIAVDVQHVRDTAGHAGGEVPPATAEHDDAAARHVLTGVVADALDDRVDSAVANAEPLAGHAAHEGFAAGRAVEGDVADDDVLLGDERALLRREDDERAAREPLAPVVVGVALEREGDTPRYEGAEALPGRAGEVDADRVVGEPLAAPLLRDARAEHGAHGPVDVTDRQPPRHRLLVR